MGRETVPSPDDLLLLPEVAEITRRSVDTLRWLRHRGEGPQGFRMGRRVVFRRGVVMEWIAQQEREQRGGRDPLALPPDLPRTHEVLTSPSLLRSSLCLLRRSTAGRLAARSPAHEP